MLIHILFNVLLPSFVFGVLLTTPSKMLISRRKPDTRRTVLKKNDWETWICNNNLSFQYTISRLLTRSSWLNCALRDDETVHWVSIGHYEAVAVGNWWYWVSRGHLCLYILHKVEIWTGVTDAWLTDWLTDNFER